MSGRGKAEQKQVFGFGAQVIAFSNSLYGYLSIRATGASISAILCQCSVFPFCSKSKRCRAGTSSIPGHSCSSNADVDRTRATDWARAAISSALTKPSVFERHSGPKVHSFLMALRFNLTNQNPNDATFVFKPLAEQRTFKEPSGKNVQKIPQPPRHPLYRKMGTLRKCN